MSIEKHVTSLEVSKKLAPYFKEAEFWWEETINPLTKEINKDSHHITTHEGKWQCQGDEYLTHSPALLATEILGRLPNKIEYFWLEIGVNEKHNEWYVAYYSHEQQEESSYAILKSGNLPDALASMFLLPVEKGVIREVK